MALAIDGSTPAVGTSSSTTVSTLPVGPFTPPAGALLLNLWAGNNHAATAPSTPTITDSLGTPLIYTLTDWQSRADSPTVDGQAAAWWAKVGSSAAMTVTSTINVGANPEKQQALAPIVLTGADTTTPIGAHGKSGSTSAASIAQSYTATATGSWGFIVVCDWNSLGNMTAGTGCTLIATGTIPTTQISYGIVRRTTADGVAGSNTTLNVNIAGTSTNLSWVYVEVLPAAPGSYQPYLPPPLLFELVAQAQQQQWAGGAATGTPTAAEGGVSALGLAATGTAVHVGNLSGTGPLGLAATGTAKKVAAQSGTCSLGLAATGSAKKVTAQTGPSALGLAATGTAVRKAPQAGGAPLGLAATGTARKVAVERGPAALGLAATSTDKKIAVERGTSTVGLAATGTAAKKTAQSGLAAVGLAGLHSGTVARQQSGAGVLGLAGTATQRKVAPAGGRTAVGLTAGATAAKKTPARGASYLGLAATRISSAARAVSGRLFLGLFGYHHSCTTHRPNAGVTTRPNAGVTARPNAGVTARPDTGTTARPDTGVTEDPC